MQLTNLELFIKGYFEAITSPGTASLLGILLGAFFLYHRSGNERLIEAGRKYKADLLTALDGLYPHPSQWPSDSNALEQKLEAIFPALQRAVEEFRPALPPWRRAALKKAWDQYRLGPDGREIDVQYYGQYMPFVTTTVKAGPVFGSKEIVNDNSINNKDLFAENVARLFSFAN